MAHQASTPPWRMVEGEIAPDSNSLPVFPLLSFDYIFIADGQCDSPVGGTVTATMETNDR